MMYEWILSSSLLIAAVLLGRLLLRGRISLRLQYALWLVVLVRLLVPFQIFVSDFSSGTIARELDISEPALQLYISANEDRYEREYAASYHEAERWHESKNRPVAPEVLEQEAQSKARESLELDLKWRPIQIWLHGMALMTLVMVFCNVHLWLRLRRSRWEYPITDSLLPVYVTEAVPTPCIFGFFRPVIYLTPKAAQDEQVRQHVLTHELTHYRHWDHIWSVLRSLCLVLHWYNPLVWMAARVSRADAELACDEGALAKLGEEHRGDYGRTLIGLTCADHGGSMFVTATTMTGSAGSIRERIKLLMKRPRNTILTLTAVILIGVMVVGCTFATAPETTEPTIPVETTPVESTEPTGHTPDNDMSYHGEDLPIPEIPEGIFNEEGVLVYPGVEWFMTEDEVAAALGITPVRFLEYRKTNENSMDASYFCVNLSDAFGVSMILDFTFRSFWPDEDPVLTEVYGTFVDPEDFEAVRSVYAHALGETDAKINPGIEERWDGDITFRELYGKEGYEILSRCAASGDDALNTPASYVQWVNNGTPSINWFTELPIPEEPDDPTSEVMALFSAEGDPMFRGALTQLYPVATMEEIEYRQEELFVPEIVKVETTHSGHVLVYYRKPGDQRLYAAGVSDNNGWHVWSNQLVVRMEDYAHLNPRALTETELQQFRSVFGTLNLDGEVNPAACFLVSYYEDITELMRRDFLAYFPIAEEGSQREFELLKAKYPEFFEDWTWETSPLPIHRYDPRELSDVLQTYADIRWEELADDGTHYLEETGAYYNYTSDFGLGGFYTNSGFVYDGGAMVCGDWSVLIFTESEGRYTIQAHLPAIVAEG